jgi:hypothetical protein
MTRSGAAVSLLCAVAACADPGPRDRSVLLPRSGVLAAARPHALEEPPGNLVGLVPDPLGPLYPEEADAVVHFEELATLERVAGEPFTDVRRLLPALGLPDRAAADVLGSAFQLGEETGVQRSRPFALVRWRGAWLAILPLAGGEPHEGLRPLDDRYALVGPATLVRAYVPSGGAAFRLRGHLSAHLRPQALPDAGRALADALALARLYAPPLAGLETGAMRGLARIDAAVQFEAREVRLDLRLTPRRDGALAAALDGVEPSTRASSRLLPPNGTIYGEIRAPAARLLSARDALLGTARDYGGTDTLAQALRILGDDFAWSIHLDPDAPGVAYGVVTLHDVSAAQAFLKSDSMEEVLSAIAGPGGRLHWTPDAARRGTISIGVLEGTISRETLQRWREAGALSAFPGAMLRGPVEAYLAIAGNQFCAVAGRNSRPAAERFFDAVLAGASGGNGFANEADALDRFRVAALAVDLAALFDGVRDAAPFWTPAARPLPALRLRARVPLTATLAVEHGALRLSASFNPRLTAALAAKALQALGIEQPR